MARRLTLRRGDRTATVRFCAADALAVAGRGTWDLLVGCAFVDLLDLGVALPRLFEAVPGGHWYFPVTFDGLTAFRPAHDRDAAVLAAYHATMDAPDRPGASESGRALLSTAPEAGGRVVAAGGSDWVVTPPYDADEAYFLHHLVHTVESAVASRCVDTPGPAGTTRGGEGRRGVPLERAALRGWARERHEQVEAAELTFLAHNLDVLGTVGDG